MTARRLYGYRWQQESKSFLRRYPLCLRCTEAGIVRLSTVVDHCKPHHGDLALFWDATNWQALCKPCHDEKTLREDRGGKPQRERIGTDGYPIARKTGGDRGGMYDLKVISSLDRARSLSLSESPK